MPIAMRIEEVRSGLARRLRERRDEIEQAVLERVYAVSEPSQASDPEYSEGLRVAVSTALEYGIEALEAREDRPPSMPTALLAQARLASRNGVDLDTVLRRYLAGYTLLGDFLIEESERGGQINGPSLKRLLRFQASSFDRLIAAVSEEYGREASSRFSSPESRQAERIRRLLAGELLDAPEITYELEGHHLGMIAVGEGAAEAFGELAKAHDRRLLVVRREDGAVWAWLGARRAFGPGEIEQLADWVWPGGVTAAAGEPGVGLGGWRVTHRQARAALQIGLRSGERMVRYADVALIASMARDDLLVTSLRELYLTPLEDERDGGAVARQTLRAYFEAERNGASAAAALGVSRQTINNRLRAVEERIGRPLAMAAMELEAALRLDRLSSPPDCEATS